MANDILTTPFGFESTTSDVLDGVDLSGKRALVTGAGSGLGAETARSLARAGASVTLAVRRLDAGEQLAQDIRKSTGNDEVAAVALDLVDQASVRRLVDAWTGPLDILVNNAGIMAVPKLQRTAEGWEMQFATNFVGHFALVRGLHDALAAGGSARIVSVSSTAHLMSPVIFDDLHYRFRPYDPWTAYGQSKTAAVLLAVEATRRWADRGIVANALNPGAIATGLQKHTGGLSTPEEFHKTVEQGAATSVFLAASPLVEGVGGRYFENSSESPVVSERAASLGRAGGVAPYALDSGNAQRLWDVACELTS
jgi:NAD(P)-dependent dehydrogenase (short-subunit alcohol dehydrogenase family)